MKKNKKQILVAVLGGSGFLGSHVADALSEAGFRVRIFDLKKSAHLRPDQEMILGDMLNADTLEKAIRGCRYVYNFAGIADLDDASTRPLDTIRLNIIGNTQLMEACRKMKVERLIYASSIYVYSEKGGFYRCSKQAAELYIEEYQRRFGLDFTILRFSTLYGPRADERNSVYRYLDQALSQHKIVYPGTGDEVRDYVHVRDAASLSVGILKEEFKNKHIIISGHHPIKFRELVLMIGEILNKKVTLSSESASHSAHYDYTPYSYAPKIGFKLTHHMYLDMGQGLLECLHEMGHSSRKDHKSSRL